jgi:hypothetical protein
MAATRQGNSLLVKVSDDGEGVSPNNRTQIFDSFFTTRRDSGGTGMGLAIVRAMLDAHGGAIRLLDSEKGDGVRADDSRGGRGGVMSHGARLNDDEGERKSLVLVRALLCLSIIACGLALRGFGLGVGLPIPVVKYGGSLLWGTMVFLLVAIAAPSWPWRSMALIALAIAVGVELFRLVHAPWLDDFRLTLPGALLLGRIFSAWNMVAYGGGIGLGVLLDRLVILGAQ